MNKPPHYYTAPSGLQVMDICDDFNLNFNTGCIIKYTIRAGKKCPEKEIEDLEKARNCLDREIQRRKKCKKKQDMETLLPMGSVCSAR